MSETKTIDGMGAASGVSLYTTELREIPLDSLDTARPFHRLSFGRDPKPLETSIHSVGLLEPALVCPEEHSGFVVVCGFRRAEALRSLNERFLPCRVLPMPLSPEERLLVSFWENLPHRGYNPAEKALVVERFYSIWGAERTIRVILPPLGLHPHRRELDRMNAVAHLPEPVLSALAEGRWFADTALALERIPKSSRESVFRFLDGLRLNYSLQREFLENLADLCTRHETRPQEFLDSAVIRDILAHPTWSLPQKADRVRRFLKEHAHPRLEAAERAFARRINDLKPPSFVRIQHAPYFETGDLHISLSLNGLRQLKEALSFLAEATESGRLEAILKFTEDPGGDHAETSPGTR